MKLSISFFLIATCTMCLANPQRQGKKGCDAYGYACYGGHGKRSLMDILMGNVTDRDLNNSQERPDYPTEANVVIDDNVEAKPRYKLIKMKKSDNMLQFYPSEANVLIDGNVSAIRRYKLIKMKKSDNKMKFYPSEANVLIDDNVEAKPRYRMSKDMIAWLDPFRWRLAAERRPEFDINSDPFSAEFLNRENN